MTKRQHLNRPAGVAIIAALAFAPTLILAQETADAGSPAMTAAPEPASPVLEPVAAPADVSLPAADTAATVEPVPASPVAAAGTATTRTPPARATAPRRTASPASAIAASPSAVEAPAPAVQEPVAAPAAPAAVSADSPAVAPTMAEPTIARPANDNTALIATLLGALVVLGLAIWGFLAIGRRKRADERYAVPVIERPVVAEPERLLAAPTDRTLAPAPAPAMAHGGASVPLPRKLPDSFEERDALLRRMIDARPDRANPFTDRKARLRRARLILQSLGRDFGDTRPWIDFSQYPQNWPEPSRNRYVAA